MKPMNEILADIVVASGGTVTAMTRNGLIQDWLNAVSPSWYSASGVIASNKTIPCNEVIACL